MEDETPKMKIARVFPRKTSATPDDKDAFIGMPTLFTQQYDEVHISVTWTYDLPEAERLAKDWERFGTVKIGGPATGMRGEGFIPGMYLKHGYVITSRGCPNKCWFCSVWKRDGTTRELPIKDGWNILDDNILACSESHIRAVFAMLKKQKRRPEFTGGLEAKLLKQWHVELLGDANPSQLFFAYDTPDDLEPLIEAGKLLRQAEIPMYKRRAYLLMGYPKDTIDLAQRRIEQTVSAGFYPCAMLWRNKQGETSADWRKFQKGWARMASIKSQIKSLGLKEALRG